MSLVHTDSFRQTPICAHSTQRVNHAQTCAFNLSLIFVANPGCFVIRRLDLIKNCSLSWLSNNNKSCFTITYLEITIISVKM